MGLEQRPVVASDISPSAFFHVIEEMQPTLLIDEADTFLQGHDELRGILNAGYHKPSGYVIRVKQRKASKVQARKGGGPSATSMLDSANFPTPPPVRINPVIHQFPTHVRRW